jgi:hypothetical protein
MHAGPLQSFATKAPPGDPGWPGYAKIVLSSFMFPTIASIVHASHPLPELRIRPTHRPRLKMLFAAALIAAAGCLALVSLF